jgi:ribosomal protein S18 acetylase RimI-like enzyme
MSSLLTPVDSAASTTRIRLVERTDLAVMLDIFSAAIPHSQLSRSIYLAPGAEAFLARLLEHPTLHAHEQLWGVEVEDAGLVAAAHTRLIGEYHHLNNYAVLPAFQRRGLGGQMMAHWHGLARSRRARRLSLDVALENDRARRHYAAFGFADGPASHEYRLEGSPDLPDPVGVELQDWPAAQASFEAYGFGRFTLAMDSERCSVDLRLGGFRLGSREPRLLAALRAMDPARAIFMRTSERLEDRSCWAYTGTIVRMTKELG